MIVYDYIKLKIKDEIMNILYLINFAGKAGTEKYVLNLINFLKGMHNCHLAYSITGPLADSVKDMNLPVFQFAMSNPLDIGAAKQLADYCRKNKIDIIHAQYPRENCIALLSKIFYYKPKVIFTSHLTLENVGTQWKILIYIWMFMSISSMSLFSPKCKRDRQRRHRNKNVCKTEAENIKCWKIYVQV